MTSVVPQTTIGRTDVARGEQPREVERAEGGVRADDHRLARGEVRGGRLDDRLVAVAGQREQHRLGAARRPRRSFGRPTGADFPFDRARGDERRAGLARSVVRFPDGDQSTGRMPASARRAAVPKATEPAPRMETRIGTPLR